MAHVYMLECSDGTLYIGSTIDLDTRLAAHDAGLGSQYTRRRLPVKLFWSAQYDRVEDAFSWEKRLQGWSHAKRIAFAEGGLDAVIGWSARTRAEAKGQGMDDPSRS